jgi:hypothetical protein
VGRRQLRLSPDRGRDPIHCIVGGGHVLRLSQTENIVFRACSFERIERFCRSHGSFDNHLEFTGSGPDGRAADPPARSTLRQLQAMLPFGRRILEKRSSRSRPSPPPNARQAARLRLALGTLR